jgi:hypothetical protein
LELAFDPTTSIAIFLSFLRAMASGLYVCIKGGRIEGGRVYIYVEPFRLIARQETFDDFRFAASEYAHYARSSNGSSESLIYKTGLALFKASCSVGLGAPNPKTFPGSNF